MKLLLPGVVYQTFCFTNGHIWPLFGQLISAFSVINLVIVNNLSQNSSMKPDLEVFALLESAKTNKRMGEKVLSLNCAVL